MTLLPNHLDSVPDQQSLGRLRQAPCLHRVIRTAARICSDGFKAQEPCSEKILSLLQKFITGTINNAAIIEGACPEVRARIGF
jgi:hypothetical protein